jgi:ankyrin repeat protein
VDVLKKLLSEHFLENWNEKDLMGRTPKEVASFYGNLEASKMLSFHETKLHKSS